MCALPNCMNAAVEEGHDEIRCVARGSISKTSNDNVVDINPAAKRTTMNRTTTTRLNRLFLISNITSPPRRLT